MTTKEKLLELFESNKGNYFSGEELAARLSLSRAAVWKAVKGLRDQGYAIDAVTNKGYCLSIATDILSPQGVRKYLRPEMQKLQLTVLSTVASTNAAVREMAKDGQPPAEEPEHRKPDTGQSECSQSATDQPYSAPSPCDTIERVLIANGQTRGRGRYGRGFFSPEGTGIYMSLLLKPRNCSASRAVRFTTMAAVAMCEAIEEVSGEKAQIKWVNDIFVRGRKICGILTEGSFDMESGALDSAVLGVGVNVYPPREGFPGELAEMAGALFDSPGNDKKNRLAAAFLNRFMEYYQGQERQDYTKEYRQRSLALGRQVTVISGDRTRNALVEDIDEECRLFVRYENGETERLSYGEIRLQQPF